MYLRSESMPWNLFNSTLMTIEEKAITECDPLRILAACKNLPKNLYLVDLTHAACDACDKYHV